ncbi:MAG: cyclic nucleotide-binding domain-containing protein [Deltaproteobacteria bacterium]|nr:cyclic nucleotide-binding domain-containing protein [Deltaproteobacteria bacterium]
MTDGVDRPTGKTRRVELVKGVFRLKGLPLFKGLNSERLLSVSEAVTQVSFPAGQVVCTEGEEARFVYILVDGEAEALRDGHPVVSYRSGDIMGELSITEEGTHPLTVRIMADATLLRMTRYDFRELLDVVPELSMNVIAVLTDRLRDALNLLKPYSKSG